MKRAIILCAMALTLAACTSEDDAVSAVKAMGMTDVQTAGYRPFSCSEDDTFKTGFTARNAKGEQVSGVVCSGWLKGATVRFD